MRSNYVDIAKAIGIILVVYGHALIGVRAFLGDSVIASTTIVAIYSFHMALFFAMSGLFIKSAMTEPLPNFFERLIKRLGHPYVVWSVILITAHLLMSKYANVPMEGMNYMRIIYDPYAVMWYLYALILFFILARICNGIHPQLALAVSIPLLIGGYIFNDVWMAANMRYFFVFVVASMIGIKGLSQLLSDRRIIAASAIVLIISFYYGWVQSVNDTDDLAYDLEFIPAMIAGTLMVLWISKRIDDNRLRNQTVSKLASILTYIGARTLPIYVSHVLFTAGARVALSQAGVSSGIALVIAATFAGMVLPLIGYEIAKRIKMERILGL